MIEISFTSTFERSLKKLSDNLYDEVVEKIYLFRDSRNHRQLKVHKLKGRLAGKYSFSVNYRYRIIFDWETPTSALLHGVGDHTIYDT